MMFQHPGTVQCAMFLCLDVRALYLIKESTSLFLAGQATRYLFRINCVFIPKGVTIF